MSESLQISSGNEASLPVADSSLAEEETALTWCITSLEYTLNANAPRPCRCGQPWRKHKLIVNRAICQLFSTDLLDDPGLSFWAHPTSSS